MNKINWINHFFNFTAVILGVFLAFYVDSLSIERKEKQELQEIIKSLIEDLDKDHNTYSEYQIPSNEEQVEALGALIELILSEVPKPSEEVDANINVNNYSPVSSTFLSLTTSGKINLIEDLMVRKALSNYYDILSTESIKKGELQVDFFMKEILPWLIENTDLTNITPDDFVGQKKMANKLILYQSFISNKIEQYRAIDESAIELKEMLSDLLTNM